VCWGPLAGRFQYHRSEFGCQQDTRKAGLFASTGCGGQVKKRSLFFRMRKNVRILRVGEIPSDFLLQSSKFTTADADHQVVPQCVGSSARLIRETGMLGGA
jgi:hypothetical protein